MKRDRLTMMSTNSSSTFSNAAVTTNVNINNSTCNASNSVVGSVSGSNDQEEYERAVAFLREFHSRRVAATTSTALHSTSLDAILEADHFDEMLASEFAMALSVGRRSSTSTTSSSSIGSGRHLPNNNDAEDVVERKGESLFGRLRRSPSSGLSRMKKTTTSKCLFRLDDDHDGDDHDESVMIRSSQESSAEPETDYYFGYEEIGPVSKRRRGLDS